MTKKKDPTPPDPRSQEFTPLERPVRLLGENILVQPVEESEDTTKSGLILPKARQNPLTMRKEAIVLVVGPGKKNESGVYTPLDVKPGDRVMFQGGAGHEMTREGRYLKLLHIQDVMAII